MYERKIPLTIDCGLHLTREVLNGKWKPALLKAISLDIKRPSQMLRLLPDATRRVLNVQLKELEMHGMVEKKIFPQLPPKVEYSLTEIEAYLLRTMTIYRTNFKEKTQAKHSLRSVANKWLRPVC
ncbi:helix-turn-helix domain-containing protein [Xanthocytophaga agilis]|uniref:Helix-turn-helix domain-containing protein n=1 Tax=Xanthocytophaga agilis TaxID=3048010 RepID=A0AAE3UFB5_9BACT|nr:helix-turn-helix domain-containing protein [Xanthocytophaga agilis]MDJ1501182.1 helix-turn-helix domain-containing protein [Xanthocytophaga agilis]